MNKTLGYFNPTSVDYLKESVSIQNEPTNENSLSRYFEGEISELKKGLNQIKSCDNLSTPKLFEDHSYSNKPYEFPKFD